MDTAHMMRHVGKVANTDQRCIVAFMQLPKRPDHCLIIPTDNLPQRMHDAIMDILRTPEGQQSMPFAVALSRHRLPDTGETVMEALHNQGKLVAMPVHNIVMLPTPNAPIKLSMILEQQGKLAPPVQQQVHDMYATEKFNPHTNNQMVNASENNRDIARGILFEAEMLEGEARKKREMAYAKDPSLRQLEAQKADNSLHTPADPWSAPTGAPMGYSQDISAQIEIPPVVMPITEPAPNPLEQRMSKLEGLLTALLEKQTGTTTDAEVPVVEAPVATDKLHKRPRKLTEEADQAAPSHE